MKDIIINMINKPLRSIIVIETLTFAAVRIIGAFNGTKVDPAINIQLGTLGNKTNKDSE